MPEHQVNDICLSSTAKRSGKVARRFAVNTRKMAGSQPSLPLSRQVALDVWSLVHTAGVAAAVEPGGRCGDLRQHARRGAAGAAAGGGGRGGAAAGLGPGRRRCRPRGHADSVISRGRYQGRPLIRSVRLRGRLQQVGSAASVARQAAHRQCTIRDASCCVRIRRRHIVECL